MMLFFYEWFVICLTTLMTKCTFLKQNIKLFECLYTAVLFIAGHNESVMNFNTY